MLASPFEKVTVVKKASDFVEGSQDMWQFFTDMRHEGIWFAVTGEHFLPWLQDAFYNVLNYSDYLIIVALLITILIIGGSGRARKWLWFTFLAYIISKSLQTLLI